MGKKLLFGMVTTAVFFLLLEFACLLAGVHPLSVTEDPYVGFQGRNPLLVPTAEGRLQTAENKLPWFNQQSLAREKPKNTFRIFCLGGSTTYGRPYNDATSFCGWLRGFLNAASGKDFHFEVINAGGISYASYRVAVVLEEVLQYAPDLVIVYTGHNEFLEHRTYQSLRETAALAQFAHAALSHTRTYSLLQRTLVGHSVNPVQASDLLPEEVVTRLDDGVGPDAFERDDHLKANIVEQFEFNLHRMVRLARAAGCEILLVSPASNLKDCSPFKSVVDKSLAPSEIAEVYELLTAAQSLTKNGQFTEAVTALDKAIAIDRRCAAAHFARGKALFELRHFRAAREAFVAARDEDVCTLRATTEILQVVQRAAMQQKIGVIDFPALAMGMSTDQIPGDQLFLDHVHPTIDGHRLLALRIVKTLIAEKHVPIEKDLPDSTIGQVTAQILGRVDQQANGDALRNLAKVFRWAGKEEEADRMALRADEVLSGDANVLYLAANALIAKGNLAQAISKIKTALELNPSHAPSWVSLGVAVQLTSRDARAAEKTRVATEAAGYFQQALRLDPDNLLALNNLASLSTDQAQWSQAIRYLQRAIGVNPRYAKAHQNLGVVYAKKRQWDLAIQSLEKAISIDPQAVQPHVDLAKIYRARAQVAEAIHHYRRALQLDEDRVEEANALSWLLATSRNASLRNGEESLKWALHCAKKTNYQNPAVFNTLAAAYAELGDFESAVRWQSRVMDAVPEALEVISQQRLDSYRANKPIRAGN